MTAKVSQVGRQHCLVVPTCRSFVEFLCSVGSLWCHIVPTRHGLEGFPCEVVRCMHYLTQNDSESQSGRPATFPCEVVQKVGRNAKKGRKKVGRKDYIRYLLMSCPAARLSLISVEEMSTAGASVIRSILLPGHSFSSRAFAADMSWPLRG